MVGAALLEEVGADSVDGARVAWHGNTTTLPGGWVWFAGPSWMIGGGEDWKGRTWPQKVN